MTRNSEELVPNAKNPGNINQYLQRIMIRFNPVNIDQRGKCMAVILRLMSA